MDRVPSIQEETEPSESSSPSNTSSSGSSSSSSATPLPAGSDTRQSAAVVEANRESLTHKQQRKQQQQQNKNSIADPAADDEHMMEQREQRGVGSSSDHLIQRVTPGHPSSSSSSAVTIMEPSSEQKEPKTQSASSPSSPSSLFEMESEKLEFIDSDEEDHSIQEEYTLSGLRVLKSDEMNVQPTESVSVIADPDPNSVQSMVDQLMMSSFSFLPSPSPSSSAIKKEDQKVLKSSLKDDDDDPESRKNTIIKEENNGSWIRETSREDNPDENHPANNPTRNHEKRSTPSSLNSSSSSSSSSGSESFPPPPQEFMTPHDYDYYYQTSETSDNFLDNYDSGSSSDEKNFPPFDPSPVMIEKHILDAGSGVKCQSTPSSRPAKGRAPDPPSGAPSIMSNLNDQQQLIQDDNQNMRQRSASFSEGQMHPCCCHASQEESDHHQHSDHPPKSQTPQPPGHPSSHLHYYHTCPSNMQKAPPKIRFLQMGYNTNLRKPPENWIRMKHSYHSGKAPHVLGYEGAYHAHVHGGMGRMSHGAHGGWYSSQNRYKHKKASVSRFWSHLFAPHHSTSSPWSMYSATAAYLRSYQVPSSWRSRKNFFSHHHPKYLGGMSSFDLSLCLCCVCCNCAKINQINCCCCYHCVHMTSSCRRSDLMRAAAAEAAHGEDQAVCDPDPMKDPIQGTTDHPIHSILKKPKPGTGPDDDQIKDDLNDDQKNGNDKLNPIFLLCSKYKTPSPDPGYHDGDDRIDEEYAHADKNIKNTLNVNNNNPTDGHESSSTNDDNNANQDKESSVDSGVTIQMTSTCSSTDQRGV